MPNGAYRAERNVLRLVQSLHLRGYQRLRIAPAMAPSGGYWRCTITPVSNILRTHGARTADFDRLTAHYSSGAEREYFGWSDAKHASPDRLAELFTSRFPAIAEAGRGSDWLYAGWYIEMLHLTYPTSLPIADADWETPHDCLVTVGDPADVRIPLPPPGEAGVPTASRREWLTADGFVELTTLRSDSIEQFAFDHVQSAPCDNLVYVALRGDEVVYVGKATSFRRRYDRGHVRWLRGEKTNSEEQRLRWVAEVAIGPVTFYGRECDPTSLATEERKLIAELRPKLNMTHNRDRKDADQ